MTKHRRARGSGSVYQQGKVWWISYKAPDGRRVAESTECRRKGDAEARLLLRTGAMALNLPIVKHAERLTFNDAAQAVIDDCMLNHKVSRVIVSRRITKHLMPVFGGRRLVGIKTATSTPESSATPEATATSFLPTLPPDIPRNRRTILLLPGGEGWDEGER